MGRQTIILDSSSKVSFDSNFLLIRTENGENKVFMEDIDTLIIGNLQSSISSKALFELSSRKINIVFLDDKKNPFSQLLPLYGSFDSAMKLREQMFFSKESKDILNYEIIRQKIMNQNELLDKLNISPNCPIVKYLDYLDSCDSQNVEGTAAKVYFHCLFSEKFNRRDESNINYALNYGYSIVASYISREIVSLGYNTSLGINHHSSTNHFNLTYDFIEPFRPFVDYIVYKNRDKEFNKDVKKDLVNVLYVNCHYGNINTNLAQAIKKFIRDAFESLKTCEIKIERISIAR